MNLDERQAKEELFGKLYDLKYEYRAEICDRALPEGNFRKKFQALNYVRLTDGEFQRLLDEIVTSDVFTAADMLCNRNSFTRGDGKPLNYTLVNITDWCKNNFEVVNQLRINTDYNHHRSDVVLLINGVPSVQIQLKTFGTGPCRAMEQIVECKNDRRIATVESTDIPKIDPLRTLGTPIEIPKMFRGKDGYIAAIIQFESVLNQPHA